MRKLTLVDQLFLMLEDDRQPMHVGGLFLFEIPQNRLWDFESIVKQMQSATPPPTFPFNQVLYNLIYWKTDTNININSHFCYVDLPQPMSMSELCAYLAEQQSQRLDRHKPLWECQMIKEIKPDATNGQSNPPNLFALYIKIHHSLLDGVAAMRLMQKSLSSSPDEIIDLPVWSRVTPHPVQDDSIFLPEEPPTKTLKKQIFAFKPALKELKNNFINRHDKTYVSATQAPVCILNQSITHARQLTAATYDMTRFERIANHYNVSINDVALTLCAGALRQYLLANNSLPSKPLIACVPTSLRDEASAAGNQLAFVLCDLATHLADPIHRLKTIHKSMTTGKNRFANMSQLEFINYGMLAYTWEGVNLLTNLYPQKRTFNIIISNVKGSKHSLYWNGARLNTLYPMSVVLNGLALNITLASYAGQMQFGLVGCAKAIPDIQPLPTFIENELSILEKVCEVSAEPLF